PSDAAGRRVVVAVALHEPGGHGAASRLVFDPAAGAPHEGALHFLLDPPGAAQAALPPPGRSPLPRAADGTARGPAPLARRGGRAAHRAAGCAGPRARAARPLRA